MVGYALAFGTHSDFINASKSVKLFVFANKIQGHEMPQDTAQTWRNKAQNLDVVCIKAMFHRHSVEHKSTHHGTAVNVPRNVPLAAMYSTALMYSP
jgi:hypothetical protein